MDQQTPTRRRISVLAAALQKGDVVRDVGIERTVTHVNPGNSIVNVVAIHFEDDHAHPDAPKQLTVDAEQPITAWRSN